MRTVCPRCTAFIARYTNENDEDWETRGKQFLAEHDCNNAQLEREDRRIWSEIENAAKHGKKFFPTTSDPAKQFVEAYVNCQPDGDESGWEDWFPEFEDADAGERSEMAKDMLNFEADSELARQLAANGWAEPAIGDLKRLLTKLHGIDMDARADLFEVLRWPCTPEDAEAAWKAAGI